MVLFFRTSLYEFPFCKYKTSTLSKFTEPWQYANMQIYYVSYIRQSNKWYHCDDKHITEANLLTLSNNVYLMFYAKEVNLGT